MSDARRIPMDPDGQNESCDAFVDRKFQPDQSCDEITVPITEKTDEDEQYAEPENGTKDISSTGKRASQWSYATENSILSSRLSLQALNALNDGKTQEEDRIHNAEEILLYETGQSDKKAAGTSDDGCREYDARCNSPLLNGHIVDNDANIKTEKPQETNSERNNNYSNKRKRLLSFLKRKPRAQTSPEDFTPSSNGDVIIKIETPENCSDRHPSMQKHCINTLLRGWLQPMDNKLNIKVFGTRKAMDEELIRYKKAGWIIHPTSAFRLEIVIIFLLLLKKKIKKCCNFRHNAFFYFALIPNLILLLFQDENSSYF